MRRSALPLLISSIMLSVGASACGAAEERAEMEKAIDCYELGYDDGYYGESPDAEYWDCRGSARQDYCEGYCDGEYDYIGLYLECNYC